MQKFILFILTTTTLLFLSCKSDNNTSPQSTREQTTIADSLSTISTADSTVNPGAVLKFGKHGHKGVPTIAEKAHQNPAKTGLMQSRIRRGFSKKGKAMRNTMKKKQEAMEDTKQQ